MQTSGTVQKFAVLEKMQKEFSDILVLDSRRRGLALEQFLYRLFALFDLMPRAPFTIEGEQIDGAFELESQHFLLEAKWEATPIGAREIRAFVGQIEAKLDNVLGLFVSLNGFTDEGVAAVQRTRPKLILMDGEDLLAVLEQRMDLQELLRRKIRHCAQTGNIYLRFRDIIGT